MPIDPNAPKMNAHLDSSPPKYHIKGDPLGRASFPKPKSTLISDCGCGWSDCTYCGGNGRW